MTKFISAEKAALLVNSNDTIGISGSGGCGSPEGLLIALEERFKKELQPKSLTITCGIAPGTGADDNLGLNHLALEGLVERTICAHYGKARNFGKKIVDNTFAAYALPLGVYSDLLRATAGKKPGILTKIGLGTFIDPCLEGGKLNKKAQKEKINLISFYNLNYEDYLFYKAFPINIAFVKASYADSNGNVSLINEAVIGEQKELVAATHNSGGIVICEVEEKVKEIKPQELVIHHTLVDYVIVHKPSKQNGEFNTPNEHDELTGKKKIKVDKLKNMPFNDRKICARRAFQELNEGNVVNLGVGIPEAVAAVAKEENFFDKITLSVEMGPLGGIPVSGICFGASVNPECINTTADTFDLYDGGYLDVAILGLAQVDKFGNVNVSKFGDIIPGPGGFINITQSTKKLLFVGTFTNKGKKKFIKNVEQITFSSKQALKNKQEVLYITEKGVFKLTSKGLELIEIAPNTDLKEDILANMDFKPIISNDLKEMNKDIFKNNE